jgi:hypothetical protein
MAFLMLLWKRAEVNIPRNGTPYSNAPACGEELSEMTGLKN